MQFFDDKQEVMDVVITPFGKHLLSQGRFFPEFYAFFDDDILYDSLWVTGSTVGEVQNHIEGRIQQDTPRPKPASVYTGIETSVSVRNDLIRDAISNAPYDSGSYVVQDTHNHKIYNQEALQFHGDKFDFLKKPLGRSQQSSNYLPAWNVSMLRGEISESQSYVSASSGIELIPQIDIKLNYKVYVSEVDQEYQWATENTTVDFGSTTFPVPTGDFETQDVSDVFPPSTIQDIASTIFDDGTYFSLQNGKIILDVIEENVNFKKENFDIQVFVTGSTFDGLNGEPQQLFFANDITNLQADNVEKYLTIHTDSAISDSRVISGKITNLNKLTGDAFTTDAVSTREFLVRDLYDPEEDICE